MAIRSRSESLRGGGGLQKRNRLGTVFNEEAGFLINAGKQTEEVALGFGLRDVDRRNERILAESAQTNTGSSASTGDPNTRR